ncbi:MAG: ankyrin repeat domain-containing protein [Helicobacteraceae bacterium]|jgi:ankyrin repeat protein|nr:ankyrin repeat domain-containing protein [Helicobacteraceae bacterium]
MKENLFELVRKGDIGVIDRLTSENINQRSDIIGSESTLLHEAIASGQDLIALELIKRGIDLNAQNKEKRTALFYAATYQNRIVAQAIIKAGADINLTDRHGNNALWAALLSSRKDYDLFEYILSAGGDINSKNIYGRSAADMAKTKPTLLDIARKYSKE